MKKTLLTLCMILGLASCGDKAQEQKANEKPIIKIGAILPLTGGAAQLGEGAKNGAIMALEQLNKNSDNHYKYELIIEDIGLSPSKTLPVYSKMIQLDKVAGLVSFNTAAGKIIKPLASKDKVLHLSSAADNTISDKTFNYVNSYSLKETSNRLVEYMKANQMKTISLVVFNHLSTEPIVQALEPVLRDNDIEILSIDRFNTEQRDFKMEALKIKELNPDMVFVHLVEPVLTLFPKQLLQDGYKGKLSSFLMFAYSANPILFEGQPFVDLREGSDDFNQEYKQRFGVDAQAASINTYDNVMLIAEFIEKNGSPKDVATDKIYEAMQNVVSNYKSPRGELMLDDGLVYSNTTIKTIKDGRSVAVEE